MSASASVSASTSARPTGAAALLALVVALLAWLLPLGAWARELPIVVQEGRVTVRAEAGLERKASGLARLGARRLAEIEDDLAGLPRLPGVEVRLVKQSSDIGDVAPTGRAPAWAVGTAYPGTGIVVVAARGRRGELLAMEKTLSHELAHLVLGEALKDGEVPRWLTEGFAYIHSSDFSLARAETLIGAVIGGKVIPFAEIEERFPAEENEVHLAYAQSYDFVAFLARRGRWADTRDDGSEAAFHEFLLLAGQGTPLNTAARQAFGRSLPELEAEWLESLRSRYLWMPIGILGTLLWGVAAILLVLAALRRRRQRIARLKEWEREEELERSRFLAAQGMMPAWDGYPGPGGASAS